MVEPMKRTLFVCALTLLISQADTTNAQRRSASATAPLRAVGGVMYGKVIKVQLSETRRASYQLDGARLVNGQIQFNGVIAESRRLGRIWHGIGGGGFISTLIGTTARATNPMPRATDASAPRREVPRQTGESNEQTQSLYTPTEIGSGCELIFLKMSPGFLQKEPVQLGVVLAHQDNPLGERINQAICRVRRALDGKGEATAAIEALDRLLKQ
jgi:hypothetical protein